MSGAAKGKGAKNASVIRVLMIGDSAVGKTSLVIRFDEDSFSTKFITTIGVDYRDKLVTIEDAPIKLQIWDTAGQERFRSLTANFFGKADGFVVCFDVANHSSFEHVSSWVADIHKNARGDVDVVLCGCKCDLPEASRQVTAAEAEALAAKYDTRYFEASAKQNVNVSEMFLALATTIKRRKLASADEAAAAARGDVDLKGQAAGDKQKCC